MNKLLLTTAIAGLISAGVTPALADNTDIDQVLLDMQTALNSISINHNSSGGSQSAINAGNLINLEEELDDVFQITFADQVASNYAFTYWGMWNGLEQTATNVANSLSLPTSNGPHGDVEDVMQIATGFADQFAMNMADYTQSTTGVTQEATNALNLISLDDVDETVVQNVDPGNFQTAMNFLFGGGDSSFVDGATQKALNVANIIDADELDVVYQNASSIQFAANLVDFGDGGSVHADLNDSIQEATNAVNVVTVDDLNTKIDQDSWATQTALNTAIYVGEGNQWDDGFASDFSQTATNVANVITVSGDLPSLSWNTEISQFSDTSQFASNVLDGMGGLNNVVQSATNVANSIGVPSGS